MSGIAVAHGISHKEELKRMLMKLEHRGDTTIINTLNNVSLGYRKNNMNGKKRPGEKETIVRIGDTSAICDGYLLSGGQFEHDSLNVIAESFQEQGAKFLQELEGCFALAASNGNSLLVARDSFGMKPLYYGRHNGTVYFASEIKELLEVTTDINIFPPSHYYSSEEGLQQFSRKTEKEKAETEDPQQAAKQLRQLIIEAVEKRYLHNERPGILLSGGLDSSIIAAAVKQISEDVQTFAVGMAGSPDLEAASLVAQHLGTEHHEHIYTAEEIMDVLSEIIYYLESFDAPLVQSAIANYFASKLAAAAGCRAVLCGEGADELFGGYHYVKNLGSEEAMNKEFANIFFIGHAMGFQRVDRMNSAHSLESHIPFMDWQVLDFAAATPLDWKIYGPQQVEKWILRKAFEHELPERVVWRRKAQFSHGTNCNSIMNDLSNARITDEEFETVKNQNKDIMLRTKEECLYYNIFKKHFPQEAAIKSVVQWAELEGDIC